MIYQHVCKVINADIEKSWVILQKSLTSSENLFIFPKCALIDIINNSDGKQKRMLNFPERVEEEVVTVNFNHYSIISTIINNPNYVGEFSYNLLKPADSFLAEKCCSLVILSAWRMLPGVFAAPIIDKQEYINSIARNLKKEIENS